MNSRQFINSAFCAIAEKYQAIRRMLCTLPIFLFPDFLRSPVTKNWWRPPNIKLITFIYFFVFIPVFLVQAIWAYSNGQFFADSNDLTKNFLEDLENLIDYIFIVEWYCILGFLFIRYSYSIDTALKHTSLTSQIDYSPPKRSKFHGFLGGMGILIVALICSAGYATEVKTYSSFYWFMASAPPNVTYGPSGYYYLFINLLLLMFVCVVTACHFNLFKTAGCIAEGLRKVLKNNNALELQKWGDENKVREWLSPFSWQILASKGFVLVVTLNMLTWRLNETKAGFMYEISVLLLAFFGIWVFSLPRYFVQYHVFRIREKIGLREYKDLRLPWIVGASTVIDIILIGILMKTLLGDVISNVLEKFLS